MHVLQTINSKQQMIQVLADQLHRAITMQWDQVVVQACACQC